ncbi:hypothetical protein ENUP19_0080G0038 [Entamoeba nuttalli]|uniref:Uncharacterized protein n=2 Tax=Entamoeba nuttalli TaxID=412467 RepID=K2H5G8_ENTNP|nr:hypothetical protein ENU1_007980 [Entamoeba nuttalli P19]EKE42853.1 hypothetical protein ENU1_007980 [Entamoeba nuttalli P19]|eukprot:XP_008854822.1 hypothetical protein ENU1_007980 [Entamoeba nuttalli P19]
MKRIDSLISDKKMVPFGGDAYEYIKLTKTKTPKKDEKKTTTLENNQVNIISSDSEEIKPKLTRSKERKRKEEKELKKYKEQASSNKLQIRQVITKYIPGSRMVHLSKTFKYFVPSTELFFENYPIDKNMYLVRWDNYSLLEATWILESEVNEKIDKNGLVKRFEECWTLDKSCVYNDCLYPRQQLHLYPFVEKIVPAKLLVPTKILMELPQIEDAGEKTTMYRVKWPGTFELFISEEPDTFFTNERTKQLLDRWKFKPKEFPLQLTTSQSDCLLTIKRNISQHYETLIYGGYGKRTTVLCYLLFRLRTTSYPKPQLIICDETSLSYYYNQLPFLFPGVPITYIVNPSNDPQIETVFNLELYDEDENVKPQLVLFCCKSFSFKKFVKFDCVLIDVQKEENINTKLIRTGICDHLIAVARENCDMKQLVTFLKERSNKKLIEVEMKRETKPQLSRLFLMLKQHTKQSSIYQQTISDLKRTKTVNALNEDLSRIMLFPNISTFGIQIKGIKMTTAEKIVRGLVELNKKVIIVSAIPQMNEALSQIFKCKVIKWDNLVSTNKDISLEFKEIPTKDENKLERNVVCLDPNSYEEGVELSTADYLLMLDDDYTLSKIDELCQTRRIGTIKDLKVIYIVIENSYDETNALSIITNKNTNQPSRSNGPVQPLNSITKFSEYEKCLEEITQAKEGITILRFGTEEEVNTFNKTKEEQTQKEQTEEIKKQVETDNESKKQNQLYVKKKSLKILMTKDGIKNIGNEYLEVIDEHSNENTNNNESTNNNENTNNNDYGSNESSEEESVEIIETTKVKSVQKEEQDKRKRSKVDEYIKSDDYQHIDESDEENASKIINKETQKILEKLEGIISHEQISSEECHKVSQLIISLLERFGKHYEDWPKGVFQIFSTKIQRLLPSVIKDLDKIKMSEEIKDSHENYQKVKQAVESIQKVKLNLDNIQPCKWGIPCDLLLLKEVKKYGLESPKLWLKNDILNFMIHKLGILDKQQQINFVLERTKVLINSLKTQSLNEPKEVEEYHSKRGVSEMMLSDISEIKPIPTPIKQKCSSVSTQNITNKITPNDSLETSKKPKKISTQSNSESSSELLEQPSYLLKKKLSKIEKDK